MKTIIFWVCLALSVALTATANATVLVIGHYTNQEITHDEDPHFLSGYSLHLYRDGAIIFGDISMGVGSEEPTTATLIDVVYDEKQHLISFQAKLSTGMENSKNSSGMRECRETISFTGTIYPDSVRGRIVRRDGYSREILEELDNITLKKSADSFAPDSYAQWKANPIGPPVAW